ncbi:uroporphyrinogen-III synthase [Acidihalobacter prosperus]|uniref:Tetrapyrrole biosynthesis uroporphyrinogen III synthase domain-containing protein n=1 Tax=Acidihalobacter prosperus TaxID=160660 RepID=A0A1A6C2V8_9GAMM|nr:uroporphyrinogen-III synthase [Acidihalobacter prosperus]OBS08880.1 hypothetical protein Thpro_023130 [Acidihalobacter prosperus]
MVESGSLSGFEGRCIALPETRQLDVLAGLLERRGAQVIRCPLVSILDTPDQASVAAWLDHFVHDEQVRDLILLTGEGVTRLLAAAERHYVRPAFEARLGQVRKIARGPKPGRALRQVGLASDVISAKPTTSGVIETLQTLSFETDRVAVQLYGSEPNLPLQQALRAKGLEPMPVAPYIYASEMDDVRVLELIDTLSEGRVDAIAFTSQPQVRRLLDLAGEHGREVSLRAALSGMLIAAVGPVVADLLSSRGVHVDVVPEERYFMRPLVDAIATRFAAA